MDVSDEELAKRRAAWTAPQPHFQRGYGSLFLRPLLKLTKAAILTFCMRAQRRLNPKSTRTLSASNRLNLSECT